MEEVKMEEVSTGAKEEGARGEDLERSCSRSPGVKDCRLTQIRLVEAGNLPRTVRANPAAFVHCLWQVVNDHRVDPIQWDTTGRAVIIDVIRMPPALCFFRTFKIDNARILFACLKELGFRRESFLPLRRRNSETTLVDRHTTRTHMEAYSSDYFVRSLPEIVFNHVWGCNKSPPIGAARNTILTGTGGSKRQDLLLIRKGQTTVGCMPLINLPPMPVIYTSPPQPPFNPPPMVHAPAAKKKPEPQALVQVPQLQPLYSTLGTPVQQTSNVVLGMIPIQATETRPCQLLYNISQITTTSSYNGVKAMETDGATAKIVEIDESKTTDIDLVPPVGQSLPDQEENASAETTTEENVPVKSQSLASLSFLFEEQAILQENDIEGMQPVADEAFKAEPETEVTSAGDQAPPLPAVSKVSPQEGANSSSCSRSQRPPMVYLPHAFYSGGDRLQMDIARFMKKWMATRRRRRRFTQCGKCGKRKILSSPGPGIKSVENEHSAALSESNISVRSGPDVEIQSENMRDDSQAKTPKIWQQSDLPKDIDPFVLLKPLK